MKIVRDKIVYEFDYRRGYADKVFFHNCWIIKEPRGWNPGGTYTGDPRLWVPDRRAR